MREITILLVDDNRDLLSFLKRLMAEKGFTVLTAESATEAKRLMLEHQPDAALLDYMLPDGNGVALGVEFQQATPQMLVMITSGTILPPEEEALCEERGFPVLRKPFLASDLANSINARLGIPKQRRVERPRSTARKRTEDGVSSNRALKVFFCYSHRDEKMRDRLDAHLSTLKRMGIIHTWHDRKIAAGSEWDAAIDKYLTSADLILLLISPDFLNSDYCYRKEMKEALRRHSTGEARVVPVILRPVDWETAPFSMLQAVPTDGRPITRWANRDEGYLDATRGIRKAAEELSATIRRA